MEFILKFAVLSPSLLPRNFIDAANANSTIEIYNPLTAFQQCSRGDKKWHICSSGYSYPEWYCPTVLEFNASHVEDIGPCFTCPDAESDCKKAVSDFLTSHNISDDLLADDWGNNMADELISYCQFMCEAGKKGDACWSSSNALYHNDSCTPGSHFCDFASDEEFASNISGTCKACPLDPNECDQDGFVTSIEGKRNCIGCTLICAEVGISRLTVNGNSIPSKPILFAFQKSYQNASGPLTNCSNLLLESEDKCPGAEGHICIVDYSVLRESEVGKLEWQLSNVAKKSGCVAIISMRGGLHQAFNELAIPFVIVVDEDEEPWPKSEHSAMVQVEVQLFGSICIPGYPVCNSILPCGESQYCHYLFLAVDGKYDVGVCEPCPRFGNEEPDPAGCFFDRAQYVGATGDQDNTVSLVTPASVTSCAKACDATLISDTCKFCPTKVSALDFGVQDKADQCYFCPQNDVQNPNKVVPLFGENITCKMVQLFFNRMEVHKDSPNCRLVQSMNYLCGCDGTGYAGANTYRKKVLLVWLPRSAAMLSIAGSLFIVYDTLRSRQKRDKLMNQLLSTLSLFDIMGSTAYALTTLPTPESDELLGAKGNKKTCAAQGFFIQIGTIACFLNVSLALYYLLTIKHGWTHEKLKRKHAKCVLVVTPIVVGLAFAFVGLPFYYNVRVWCNNAAKWWPEIPVILAIIAATGIMGTLCHHVYKIETRTAQYTDIGTSLSMKVFKQSCWFVVSFYITWVPYVTLQYMWSSGQGYDNFGLILTAATLVPLQGFWNNFIYIRPRYLSKMVAHVGSSFRRVSSFLQRRSKADATKQSALDSLQQSGAHDQLQVVHVCRNAVISSLDEDCKSANAPSEKKSDDRTFDATYRDILDPKSDNDDGGGLKGSSCSCENGSNAVKESFVVEKPLKALTNNDIQVDQAVKCPTSGKEIIGACTDHENAFKVSGLATDNFGLIKKGECIVDKQSLRL